MPPNDRSDRHTGKKRTGKPVQTQAADDADEPEFSGPSKTQLKKEMHALQMLGEDLVQLNDEQLAEVPLPERLRDAIVEAKRIRQHEGRRRQMQYVGRLMREIDAEPVREKLAGWNGVSREATALLHHVERWRERLLDDDAAMQEFAAAHQTAELQQLRTLVRSIRKERAGGKPPKHYRELFRVLREILEPAG
jgi:ribosome-associated protein